MRFVLVLTITIFLGISPAAAQDTWPFFQNYSEARFKAQQSQTPLYVHFTASWCMPCIWMAENSYQNEQVLSQLNSMVPLSVDIESNEGKILREKFQIEILPTLLIVDAQNEQIIARKEKSLSGADLYSWLNEVLTAPVSNSFFIEIGQYLNLAEAYQAQEIIQKIVQEKIALKEKDAFYYLLLGNFSSEEIAQNKLSQIRDLGINGQIKSF